MVKTNKQKIFTKEKMVDERFFKRGGAGKKEGHIKISFAQ